MSAHQFDAKTVARFWSKVNKNGPVPKHRPELGPCWVWTAGRRGDYGAISVGPQRANKNYATHRFSWAIHAGADVPDGLNICHKCDNPRCVNPSHLVAETQRFNVRDAYSKGRARFKPGKNFAKGERHGSAKLTADKVARMRAMFTVTNSNKRIAEEFGVSTSTVEAIKCGRLWKHIP